MKKRLLVFLTALALLCSLTVGALAETGRTENGYYYFTDRNGNEMMAPVRAFASEVIEFIPGSPVTSYENQKDPNVTLGVPDRTGDRTTSVGDCNLGKGGVLVLGYDVAIYDGDGLDIYVFEVGDDVEDTLVEVSDDLVTWYEVGVAAGATAGVDMNGKVPEGARFRYIRLTDQGSHGSGSWPGADIDAVCGLSTKAVSSRWAEPEIEKAFELDLVPERLERADFSKRITRSEFAAVAVKVYENLSGKTAEPAAENPFTDTEDPEVLKAYALGVVTGVGDGLFAPDAILNREQCATMLTRVYKIITVPGWTLAADKPLDFEMPELFADDADISPWARDSVYFMASKNIIRGVGDNLFAPRNLTTEQEALGYADATREAALAIAVRMVENLK